MNNKSCLKCNKSTNFSDSPPKYCSFCGSPFAGVAIAAITESYEVEEEKPSPIRRLPRPRQQIEPSLDDELEREREYEEDDRSARRFPKITIPPGDLCEIKLPPRQKENLGQLALDKTPRQILNNRAPKKINSKKMIEEFKRETSSKQPSQEIGGGISGE